MKECPNSLTKQQAMNSYDSKKKQQLTNVQLYSKQNFTR